MSVLHGQWYSLNFSNSNRVTEHLKLSRDLNLRWEAITPKKVIFACIQVVNYILRTERERGGGGGRAEYPLLIFERLFTRVKPLTWSYMASVAPYVPLGKCTAVPYNFHSVHTHKQASKIVLYTLYCNSNTLRLGFCALFIQKRSAPITGSYLSGWFTFSLTDLRPNWVFSFSVQIKACRSNELGAIGFLYNQGIHFLLRLRSFTFLKHVVRWLVARTPTLFAQRKF